MTMEQAPIPECLQLPAAVRTITVADVRQAYLRTGLTPIRKHAFDGQGGADALTAVWIDHIGVGRFANRGPGPVGLMAITWGYASFGKDYTTAFNRGWDDMRPSKGIRGMAALQGVLDGRAAAAALFGSDTAAEPRPPRRFTMAEPNSADYSWRLIGLEALVDVIVEDIDAACRARLGSTVRADQALRHWLKIPANELRQIFVSADEWERAQAAVMHVAAALDAVAAAFDAASNPRHREMGAAFGKSYVHVAAQLRAAVQTVELMDPLMGSDQP